MNQWIPVTEEIPKIGESVLVNYEDGEVWVDFFSILNSFFGESENHGKVIAWMTLPAPYKATEEVKEASDELG